MPDPRTRKTDLPAPGSTSDPIHTDHSRRTEPVHARPTIHTTIRRGSPDFSVHPFGRCGPLDPDRTTDPGHH